MHILGLRGMPRRVYTYQADMPWHSLNLTVSAGALIFFVSFLLFLWNALRSLTHGRSADANPWDAPGLEWASSSPPPPHNFDRIPVVTSHSPLWEIRDSFPAVAGLAVKLRQVLITSVGEAVPQLRSSSPSPTIMPLFAALGTTIAFVGSIFTPWAAVWGSVLAAVPMLIWFWPKGAPEDEL
jgi:cytochrome c oxidase subunit 1